MAKVSKKEKIDVVIPWVDGNDIEWQKEKAKYDKNNNGSFDEWTKSNIRYRDWDTLKYVFRSIEKNMNWINKIFFVTCGQTPEWLDTSNPKLVLVNHKDYIPSKYLPTFNSNVIELNFHRINGLSENFIAFNDDMFILKKTKSEDFFKKGLPVHSAILNVVMPDDITHPEYYNTVIINKYFNKKDVMKKNFTKWFNIKYFPQIVRTFFLLPWPKFTRLYETHLPIPQQKKYFELLWKLENNKLDRICNNKFRGIEDLSHWLMSDWYRVEGKFIPRCPNLGKHYETEINEKIVKIIKNKKYKIVCINDVNNITDQEFKKQKELLVESLEYVFPNKSSFEK